jgi:hypothetical protein
MVEARFGDAAPELVSIRVDRTIERDGEVEGSPGSEARSYGDDRRRRLRVRDAYRALVRMSREVLDDARRGLRIGEQLVDRLCRPDSLEIAVSAGVVVGPRDRRSPAIVDAASGRIRLRIAGLKEVSASDAAQRRKRGSEVLVIAGRDAA